MGVAPTKILSYLDVGTEEKEDKLKSKYAKVLTSGKIPKKPALSWKSLALSVNDSEKTASNLKEGAQFIHVARSNKENILVNIAQSDPDSIIFANAYVMMLSGLSPDYSNIAIANAIKDSEIKLEGKYKKALEALHKQAPPKLLREQLFQSTGTYPIPLLTEDVNKIYALAGLSKPSLGQVLLDSDPTSGDNRAAEITGPSSHANQTREMTVPAKQPESASAPEKPRDGQHERTPMAHTPMTLAETENQVPVGPAIRTWNHTRRDPANLAEAQSAHIDEALLKHEFLQSLTRDNFASSLSFVEHSVNNYGDYEASVTEWNSVRSNDSEIMKPTLAASVKSQRSEVVSEPEQITPALTSLVASTKPPTPTPESPKPRVSEETINILTTLKGTAENHGVESTRNKGIRINGYPFTPAKPVERKRSIEIIRAAPANIDEKMKVVNECIQRNSISHKTKRTSIQIIKQLTK